jgi:hypothetical protein
MVRSWIYSKRGFSKTSITLLFNQRAVETMSEEKQKLIKVKREQIITKSGVYFILTTILLISFLAFFFLIMGGFSEIYTGAGGNKRGSMIAGGVRIVFFGGMSITCAIFYLIANEVRTDEQKLYGKPSVYKIGAKKFWRWLWSDIKRSKR